VPNRIADPWGVRTPFGRGEGWPQRVDSLLADGVAGQDVDRWVRAASLLHSNGDAMDIAVKDGSIVGVRGRAQDRVNHGRLERCDPWGHRSSVPLPGRAGRRVRGLDAWAKRWGGGCRSSRRTIPR